MYYVHDYFLIVTLSGVKMLEWRHYYWEEQVCTAGQTGRSHCLVVLVRSVVSGVCVLSLHPRLGPHQLPDLQTFTLSLSLSPVRVKWVASTAQPSTGRDQYSLQAELNHTATTTTTTTSPSLGQQLSSVSPELIRARAFYQTQTKELEIFQHLNFYWLYLYLII